MRFTNIDVNKKVNLFNKTIRNIIRINIAHETISQFLEQWPSA